MNENDKKTENKWRCFLTAWVDGIEAIVGDIPRDDAERQLVPLKRKALRGTNLEFVRHLCRGVTSEHYGTIPGHFETSIIHFPTSEGVSEMSE